MELEKALNIDFRKESSRKAMQEVLMSFKPIAKRAEPGSEVKLELIEKFVKQVCKRGGIKPQWVLIDVHSSEDRFTYTCSVVSEKDHKWLGTAYGFTLYEVMAKLAVLVVIESRKLKESNEG